ncbi:hypothetical protein CR513_38285, partial [Mucuna pruriens]
MLPLPLYLHGYTPGPQLRLWFCHGNIRCYVHVSATSTSHMTTMSSVCGEVKEGMIGCDSSVQHTCIVRESKPIRKTEQTTRARERESKGARKAVRVTQQNDAWGEAIKRDSNFARKKIDKDMHLHSK